MREAQIGLEISLFPDGGVGPGLVTEYSSRFGGMVTTGFGFEKFSPLLLMRLIYRTSFSQLPALELVGNKSIHSQRNSSVEGHGPEPKSIRRRARSFGNGE